MVFGRAPAPGTKSSSKEGLFYLSITLNVPIAPMEVASFFFFERKRYNGQREDCCKEGYGCASEN